MKTIELSTGTLLVVDATRANVLDCMWQYHPCTILGHPSEITGEVWGKVVETVDGWSKVLYYDYVAPCSDYRDIVDAAHEDPLASGLSLCAAHNIQESDVLLFKYKNS